MTRDTFDYSHGDQGQQPGSSLNFKSGGRPKASHFDWFWFNVIAAINGHASEFDELDSNDDGIVDEADYANDADASTYKGNDIDPDGDGVVDEAGNADKIDGVHLANIDWAHLALAQSDLDISDINPADTDLDMGGNVVQNTGGVVLPVGKNEWA